MVNKAFRLEDLRLYRIEDFADARPIERILRLNRGYIVCQSSGLRAERWIIYAAPHSLNQQFLDEIKAFEADKAKPLVAYPQFAQAAFDKACERLADIPDPKGSDLTKATDWGPASEIFRRKGIVEFDWIDYARNPANYLRRLTNIVVRDVEMRGGLIRIKGWSPLFNVCGEGETIPVYKVNADGDVMPPGGSYWRHRVAVAAFNGPVSTIEWQRVTDDMPATLEPRQLVFYASERDGTIFQGFSDQVGQGVVWWAKKPLGPLPRAVTIRGQASGPLEICPADKFKNPIISLVPVGRGVVGTREKAVTRVKVAPKPQPKEFVVIHQVALRTPGEILYYAGILAPPMGVAPSTGCASWSFDKSKAIRWTENDQAIHGIAERFDGVVAELVTTQGPLESGPKPAP